MPILNPAFLIHILLELPASLNFFFRPNEQLSSPAPQAHALIRQYAVLLLSSNIIALVFAFRHVDEISRRVAGALAIYHAAPLVRAVGRITSKKEGYGKGLGGPWVHAVGHAGALGALGWVFLR
ncbi:hypothetical protein ACEPPN_013824 [Leptodophora sp. 'Broadleaf-Isolate-01']